MKSSWTKIAKILGLMSLLFLLLLLISFMNHQIQLNKEEKVFIPIGAQVLVNGHAMNVYAEGEGERTLIFMSGGGTSSPVLDFKTLSAHLNDNYTTVVVEKVGYGFSDVADIERSIDAILADTREALILSEFDPPYVLVPHSMSGLEALYWAQQYPNEVTGIVGLDMAVPSSYDNYPLNMPMIRLAKFAADTGITRFLPGVAVSEAVKYGELTEKEKELSEVIFYRRTSTTTMLNEIKQIKENAEIVDQQPPPNIPILLFSSNGEGTGLDAKQWKEIHQEFVEEVSGGKIIDLDVSHYIHNHAYVEIAEEIIHFIEKE